MSGVRARRAGIPREQARLRPLYARLLGLQYLSPSGFLCFAFFEGAIALGILLALAELVSWWGVVVLPVTVALMVKLNDVIAGALTPTTARPAVTTSGVRAGVSASGAGLVVRPATTRRSGSTRPAGPGSAAARDTARTSADQRPVGQSATGTGAAAGGRALWPTSGGIAAAHLA